MPRKGGGSGVPRFRENSRVMRVHEAMVDLISGRPNATSFLDVFSSGIFGIDLGFLRSFEEDLENDIIYSDDEVEEERAATPVTPHPRIKQLTDAEADEHAKESLKADERAKESLKADQHAKELIEEEERLKGKSEKNRRKKKRKKEKKRIEKQSAVQGIVPEGEQDKSGSSENLGEKYIIESNIEAEESAASASGERHNEAGIGQGLETVLTDESSSSNSNASSSSNEEDNVGKMNEDGDGESKDLDLNNAFGSAAASAAEEPPDLPAPTVRKRKKKQLLVVQQPEKEKSDVLEEPEVQKGEEENQDIAKEKTTEANLEDYVKRSRELAGIGNQLAASGQFQVAVKCFTDAIKFNPKEYKLFGNRSLCYERLQQYEPALMDADLALSMEPNWIKGLFRKGKALCGLKRYYQATLIYKEVLRLDSSSAEATLELKRAQTLHLMEMGFSWAQSSDALRSHGTLEEAIEALFGGDSNPGPGGKGGKMFPGTFSLDAQGNNDNTNQLGAEDEEGEWTVLPSSRPRMKESGAVGQTRPEKSQSPTLPGNSGKPQLFPVWVGSLAPTVTYTTLHTIFSRAGTILSIKMILDNQCAFVHFARREDCERAIQQVNGMVLEGAPVSVRHPYNFHPEISGVKSAPVESFPRPVTPPRLAGKAGNGSLHRKNIKECFFWRTTGCTKQDRCLFRHIPEHKNIDREKLKLKK